MAIKQILENALKSMEQEKDRAVAMAKEKATREKVIPNNAAIDASRTDAINALSGKLNEEIAKLQASFNSEKEAIIQASEKKKSDFAASTLETESSVAALEYDVAINALKKQITEIKE